MEFEEFSKKCCSKVCLRHTMYNEKTCARAYKQEDCFKKYLKKLDSPVKARKPIKVNTNDAEWKKVREQVFERDQYTCQLTEYYKRTDPTKYFIAVQKTRGQEEAIDPAHIFGKKAHPVLKYYNWNIITLNHWFHMALDGYNDPLTGRPITYDERMEIMLNLVPEEEREKLIKIAREA